MLYRTYVLLSGAFTISCSWDSDQHWLYSDEPRCAEGGGPELTASGTCNSWIERSTDATTSLWNYCWPATDCLLGIWSLRSWSWWRLCQVRGQGQQSGRGPARLNGVCFQCGQDGHYSTVCTQPCNALVQQRLPSTVQGAGGISQTLQLNSRGLSRCIGTQKGIDRVEPLNQFRRRKSRKRALTSAGTHQLDGQPATISGISDDLIGETNECFVKANAQLASTNGPHDGIHGLDGHGLAFQKPTLAPRGQSIGNSGIRSYITYIGPTSG